MKFEINLNDIMTGLKPLSSIEDIKEHLSKQNPDLYPLQEQKKILLHKLNLNETVSLMLGDKHRKQ